MKFLPGCPVMTGGTAKYASPGEAGNAPLVQGSKLMGSRRVSADFIWRRQTAADWHSLEPVVTEAVSAFFLSGETAVIPEETMETLTVATKTMRP